MHMQWYMAYAVHYIVIRWDIGDKMIGRTVYLEILMTCSGLCTSDASCSKGGQGGEGEGK